MSLQDAICLFNDEFLSCCYRHVRQALLNDNGASYQSRRVRVGKFNATSDSQEADPMCACDLVNLAQYTPNLLKNRFKVPVC